MPIPGSQFKAAGNIYPCRFVKLDTTQNNAVLQSTAATSPPFGVSQEGTDKVAVTGLITSTYAAVDGENLRIFQPGEVCLIEASAAITAGDLLKADSNGKAATATAATYYGARALEAASAAGEKILVRVETGYKA